MKKDYSCKRKEGKFHFHFLLLLWFFFQVHADAQADTPLRRPISPSQPMYLIHIDTWNYPDPQKIINLIPVDIRPYVVMNISLSISHDEATSRFRVAEYGYEIAKSWLRVCAQNQMWAMVQHSSGGYAQFSDFELSVYEEFYREYPNLIGFNYAEQFWGYDDQDPISPKWTDRINHFANLLKLSNKYGGYLTVSWCGNQWSPAINPIGMLKQNPAFAAASERYTKNYLLFEKYTQESYQSDMESLCLGAYLSGYSGNYGIRYDDTGWTDANGEHKNFSMATAGAVHLEHMMLTGATMLDGPELIWTQCFRETNRIPTTDGYMTRNWETFPQFINVTVDIFRKILDGTVRIPTRQEVIDRTKYVVVKDVNTGSSDLVYSSPETLFEGLYRMDGDGNLQFNKSFFKKTGRYPTIPTVFKLKDEAANSFQYKINQSAYASRWPTIQSKVDEFNSNFPEEYTGNLYAGRHENGWVIYNPFKTGQTASASIPFKYNTAERVELTYSQYTASVMKEYADRVTFYLSNHDNALNTGLKTDVIRIYGSTSAPTYTYTDRGNHQGSIVTSNWSNGVFTLTVQHNGPLDITINCAGTATGRLTAYTQANLLAPVSPPVYAGPRQYEGEIFDYKNIQGITTSGYSGSIRNYTGQGYLQVGTSASASVRSTVQALRTGKYKLITRYTVAGDVSSLDLYVNGVKVATPTFTSPTTANAWEYNTQTVELNAGTNIIEYKASRAASYSLVIDNIVLTQGNDNGVYHFENDRATTNAATPPAELVTLRSGTAGVVAYTNAAGVTSNTFKAYSAGTANATGVADLDMFYSAATDYGVVWKEYYTAAGGKKGLLMRGNGTSTYAEGLKQGYLFVSENNTDNTVTLRPYVVTPTGLEAKPAYTTTFQLGSGKPYWYRATANGNQLIFECSQDSINWMGGTATTYTDNSHTQGAAQLVWGLGSNNFDWRMDNIASFTGNVAVSRLNFDRFSYAQNTGPSLSQSFRVWGSALVSDLTVRAPEGFELSLNQESAAYSPSISITPVNGTVESVPVYVRMKGNLPVGVYKNEITIGSERMPETTMEVSGYVSAYVPTLVYDFSSDNATTSASSPPATGVTVGHMNSATAGVVSYRDANNYTSNMLRPYSNGQRNATGVLDLDLFPKDADDYSVTWKQHLGSSGVDYKIGVLLRGDTENVGGETTGYVQGIMQGYLFLAYKNQAQNKTEFRIYRSTATGLETRVNVSVNDLSPGVGVPVWFRATVSGKETVSLKFEYSRDGTTWTLAASNTDNVATFATGATQLVWGLAAPATDFFLDDITLNGLNAGVGGGVTSIREEDVAPTVLFEEYYTIMGHKVQKSENLKGLYIVRSYMSNGAVITKKLFFL
ncbi:glycoside hydrolase family 98 domain-containing protein [Botryobacter ruber]|uniref:glycoside hydrolase family 98 domain-containing protein n=1 Tax=Botryobacter ruber TaxID=2171629 RepID=UPI000E0BF424|nr:glycoside hydrolase family 98 domain-containing protein [Botryobacter ruber]